MDMKKIVVVDDDRDQQAALRVRLSAEGYKVVCATDAMQAVAVVRQEIPDLVLLDIGLPGGDGHTVLERLRMLTPTSAIPVIVLSAKEPSGHRDRMIDAGAEAYFQKPANDVELLSAIRKALGETEVQTTETFQSLNV